MTEHNDGMPFMMGLLRSQPPEGLAKAPAAGAGLWTGHRASCGCGQEEAGGPAPLWSLRTGFNSTNSRWIHSFRVQRL